MVRFPISKVFSSPRQGPAQLLCKPWLDGRPFGFDMTDVKGLEHGGISRAQLRESVVRSWRSDDHCQAKETIHSVRHTLSGDLAHLCPWAIPFCIIFKWFF